MVVGGGMVAVGGGMVMVGSGMLVDGGVTSGMVVLLV